MQLPDSLFFQTNPDDHQGVKHTLTKIEGDTAFYSKAGSTSTAMKEVSITGFQTGLNVDYFKTSIDLVDALVNQMTNRKMRVG